MYYDMTAENGNNLTNMCGFVALTFTRWTFDMMVKLADWSLIKCPLLLGF
jgi:hypothetical protein